MRQRAQIPRQRAQWPDRARRYGGAIVRMAIVPGLQLLVLVSQTTFLSRRGARSALGTVHPSSSSCRHNGRLGQVDRAIPFSSARHAPVAERAMQASRSARSTVTADRFVAG